MISLKKRKILQQNGPVPCTKRFALALHKLLFSYFAIFAIRTYETHHLIALTDHQPPVGSFLPAKCFPGKGWTNLQVTLILPAAIIQVSFCSACTLPGFFPWPNCFSEPSP